MPSLRLRITCVQTGETFGETRPVFHQRLQAYMSQCGRAGFVHFLCSGFPEFLHRIYGLVTSVFPGFFTLSTGLTKTTTNLESS